MIDEPGTELSLPGFMYDEDEKMVKKEAIRMYSLSRTFIEEIARESGAMYKIGKF